MLGQVIKAERIRRGLTRRQLAEATGYSVVQVWRIETGKRGARLSLEALQRFARGLSMSQADLLRKINGGKRRTA